MTTETLDAEAIERGAWLATWVVSLIDDGRIDDLDLDDEYVRWARQTKATFLELRGRRGSDRGSEPRE